MTSVFDQYMQNILRSPNDKENLPKDWPTAPSPCYESQKEYKDSPLYKLWCSAQKDAYCSGENAFGLFRKRCEAHPDKPAVIWLDGEGKTQETVSFGELLERIRSVAFHLQAVQKVEARDRVLLCYPPGIDFMVGFWACLSIYAVAVPVCPPEPFNPTNDVGQKLSNIINDCEPCCCLTNCLYRKAITAGQVFMDSEKTIQDKNSGDIWHLETLDWITTDDLSVISDTEWDFSGKTVNNGLAFLQYTSGSTGQPKGVKVSHQALLQNAYLCVDMTHSVDSFLFYKHSVAVSWLPTFHDMGLIGFHVVNMVVGTPLVCFSPLDFIKNPILWLKVMSRYKRVVTGAPPFALDLCVRKMKEADWEEIELSNVAGLILGAEPIKKKSLDGFAKCFGRKGFNPNAYLPCYGLAENVLYVVGKKSDVQPVTTIHVDTQELREGRLIEVDNNKEGIDLISSGEIVDEEQTVVFIGDPTRSFQNREPVVLVVDPDTCKECKDGVVGEIWISGACLAEGYWNETKNQNFGNVLASAENEGSKVYVNNDKYKFLKTGDLGAVQDRQLFVTGRIKDMIIINGVNFYPHDIEHVVTSSHGSLKQGGVVAIAVQDNTGTERLAVVAEVRDKRKRGAGLMSHLSPSSLLDMVNAAPTLSSLLYRGFKSCKDCRTRSTGPNDLNNEAKAVKADYSQEELKEVVKTARIAILKHFGIPVAHFQLVAPKSVKKTSSGKLSRAATKKALLQGDLRGSTLALEASKLGLAGYKMSPKEETEEKTDEKLDVIKRRIMTIVIEELDDVMSEELVGQDIVDPDTPLDSYGLDSVTAVRMAQRLTEVFELETPLSVFMFIGEPTLNGVAKVILKLQSRRKNSDDCASEENLHVLENVETDDLPHILGIGTTVPETGGPQEDVIQGMKQCMQLDPKKEKFLEKIGKGCKIARRHTVHKDPFNVFWGKRGIGNDEGMDKRNAVFKEEAPKLALQASEKALADWGGHRKDITHVVSVTCTGIIIPGLEFHVMQGLGLSPDTQRLSITFMGCFGALAGLKAARGIACASKKNRVLVVCCELCSLHMQLRDDIDNLVGSCLFSDGCGAFIVGQPAIDEKRIFELHHDLSRVIPNTLDMMAWDLSSTGFIIGLDKGISGKIFEHMEPFCNDLLQVRANSDETTTAKVNPQDCIWAIHPGGPMIIQAILDSLDLSEDHARASWETLHDFGNMSSATLVFVWDQIRRQQDASKKWVPALAFGPGLNVEGALLRHV